MKELQLFDNITFYSPILVPNELDEAKVLDDLLHQKVPVLPIYIIRDTTTGFIAEINRTKPPGAPDISIVIMCYSFKSNIMS